MKTTVKMPRWNNGQWPAILTLTGSIVLTLVLWLRYPGAIAYEEQLHLFMFSKDFFLSEVSLPGGFSLWLSELLVQFYFHPFAGAAVIGFLYGSLTWLLWHLSSADSEKRGTFMLTFLPILALLWLCRLSLQVPCALLLTLLSMLLCRSISDWRMPMRWPFLALLMIVVYILAGSGIFVVLLYLLLTTPWKRMEIVGRIVLTAWCFLLPCLAGYVAPYPQIRLYLGINIHTLAETAGWLYIVAPLLFALVGAWAHLMVLRRGMQIITSVIVGVLAVLIFSHLLNPVTELSCKYDQYVRYGEWERTVTLADRQPPVHPHAMIALNLALAKQGLLLEKLENYRQFGTEGLLSDCGLDMAVSFAAVDAYYALGLNEMAQRCAFELQESLPMGQRSGRCLVMLTKTNIVAGNELVARKYLEWLSQSLFYARWAQQTLQMLDSGKLSKEYTSLREHLVEKNEIVYYGDMERWLTVLCRHDASNWMAAQYLKAWQQFNR